MRREWGRSNVSAVSRSAAALRYNDARKGVKDMQAKLFPLAIFIAAAWHPPVVAKLSALLEPPVVAQRFTSLVVPGIEAASPHVRRKAFERIKALVERHRCPSEQATLFRKDDKRLMVLLVPCRPLGNRPDEDVEHGYYKYIEYPIAYVVEGDDVAEASLYQHGFLYNTGVVSAITDVDNNGMPEFWLSGDVCGETDDDQCKDPGLKVLEFNKGQLRSWSPPGP